MARLEIVVQTIKVHRPDDADKAHDVTSREVVLVGRLVLPIANPTSLAQFVGRKCHVDLTVAPEA